MLRGMDGTRRLLGKGEVQFFRHFDQLRQRSSLHFTHHLAPLGLHGDLAGTEFRRDLLIQLARNHQVHNLSLAGGQRAVALL